MVKATSFFGPLSTYIKPDSYENFTNIWQSQQPPSPQHTLAPKSVKGHLLKTQLMQVGDWRWQSGQWCQQPSYIACSNWRRWPILFQFLDWCASSQKGEDDEREDNEDSKTNQTRWKRRKKKIRELSHSPWVWNIGNVLVFTCSLKHSEFYASDFKTVDLRLKHWGITLWSLKHCAFHTPLWKEWLHSQG